MCWNEHNHAFKEHECAQMSTTILHHSALFFSFFQFFPPQLTLISCLTQTYIKTWALARNSVKKEKDKLGENMGLKLSQIMVYHYFIVCRQCGGSFVHFRANEIVLLLCS